MSNWILLGEDTLLNLDKVWHVSHTASKRKEWEYELSFLVEVNFPDPNMSEREGIWHEVRENFQTREDMMTAFNLVARHIGALSVDRAVEKHKEELKQFGIRQERREKSSD